MNVRRVRGVARRAPSKLARAGVGRLRDVAHGDWWGTTPHGQASQYKSNRSNGRYYLGIERAFRGKLLYFFSALSSSWNRISSQHGRRYNSTLVPVPIFSLLFRSVVFLSWEICWLRMLMLTCRHEVDAFHLGPCHLPILRLFRSFWRCIVIIRIFR